MKKFLKPLLSATLCMTTVFSAAGCVANTGNNLPQNLDVYLLYKGYQDEWLTSALQAFEKEAWVKEKYPNFSYTYTFNQSDGFAGDKLAGGASINSFDLMFGVNLGGLSGTNIIADLTDIVYNATIPEENVTVKSKIPEGIMNMAAYEKDNQTRYYTMCYVQGFWSMLYNKGLLDEISGTEGWIPVTTQEFLDVCADIKATGYEFSDPTTNTTSTSHTAIMLAHNGYWNSALPSWFAQYEGLQGWGDFFNGYYEEEISAKVMMMKGRLRALQVIEDIFESGYGYEKASEKDYIFAQTNFLAGNGVFHYNGDYFVSEMSDAIDNLAAKGIDEDIRYMKMPVISALVERLSFYNEADDADYDALSADKKAAYDEKLANIVRDIDNNLLYSERSTANQDVTENDWAIVAEARQLAAYSTAGTQTAVIPDYSPSKELAADFLKYMYSDKMLKNFVVSSGGNIIPSTTDWTQQPDVYDQIHDINKSKFSILNGTSNYPFLQNPPMTSYKLGRAGLKILSAYTDRLEVEFMLPANQRNYTAQKIYDMDIAYWTESAWSQFIAGAGY